jgi:putative PEP-CTERM system histidine kinase
MEALNLDLPTCSALLAALAYTACVARLVHLGAVGPDSPRANLLFGAALSATALWGWIGAIEPYSYAIPTFVVALIDLARYALWFAFLLTLLAPVVVAKNIRWLALAATILIAVGIHGPFAVQLPDQPAAGWARVPLFGAMALPVLGLVLLEQLFRNLADDSRWNAKPLTLGLGLVFVYDLYLYSQAVLFGRADEDAVTMRGTVHALAVPLLLIASRRSGNWVARLHFSRTAAFHSAALVLAGIYLLGVAAIGYYIRYFGGTWGSALQLVMLVGATAALVVLAMSGAMRARLRVLLRKHFFSYRYDYREEWLKLTAMLSARSSPAEMGTLVIRGLADMVESPCGALWTQATGQHELVQSARWNVPASKEREPIDSDFARFLRNKGWVVDLDQYRSYPQLYEGMTLPTWLRGESEPWLVIPLIVADDLTGFVVLGPARTRVELDWEAIDLLKTASRQAAGFLAQMQATEALLESRKFDAFNRMSAFVVHDLKNIVTQLSLMLRNAKRLHDNPEFQADMLSTIENSVDKMRQLMLQLREGEAPPGGQSGVDLVPIVRRLKAVAAERGRTVEIQGLEPLVARGHEVRIERVLGHVVQNALDATQPSGRVWLKLARSGGQAEVEIGDTGNGMSQEFVENRLFKPFETTKPAGMGIGAYESYQYIRELGGKISVDSELARGTVMTIALPLFDARQPSDLQMASAK